MCDLRIPIKLKGKFYKIAIRPAMLNGTKCQVIKEMSVVEMRMLRCINRNIRNNRI